MELPSDCKALLSFFDTIISIGLPILDTPLQCLGAGGFISRLAFFDVFPLIALALLFLVHVFKVAFRSPLTAHRSPLTAYRLLLTAYRLPLTAHRLPLTAHRLPLTASLFPLPSSLFLVHVFKVYRHDELTHVASKKSAAHIPASDVAHLSELQGAKFIRSPLPVVLRRAAIAATPSATRFLFIVYPILTTKAFEAFPCVDLGGDGRWLIADVAVQCGTDTHSSAKLLAWVTVLVYPVGLLLAAATVLGLHKEEAQGTSPPTELSEAIHFLYGNYKPDAYYWEVCDGAWLHHDGDTDQYSSTTGTTTTTASYWSASPS